ncbi:MAG: hypothetical protein LBP62_00815 [Clostridiales bacterium]|nr:hypothetical protein [Clostridiales bacterium]
MLIVSKNTVKMPRFISSILSIVNNPYQTKEAAPPLCPLPRRGITDS